MIKELPDTERPRERLKRFGSNSLSNEELLSILIRIGIKNMSVKDVAMNILKNFNSINELEKVSLSKLAKIKGVGEIKAMSILAAIELGRRIYLHNETEKIKITSTDLIYELFKNKYKFVTQEKLIAVFLDAKNQIIDYKTIFIGTVDASTVHPREIFKEAINLAAVSIIIVHNHPSGDPTPSLNDIVFTSRVEQTGEIMAIPLIDHVIIGNTSYSSYKGNKWADLYAKNH